MKKTKQETAEQEPGIWTIPVTDGAAQALRDHHKLINPLICERAQELAREQSGLSAHILRTHVEKAIIESQQKAIKSQAIRIRDLITSEASLQHICKALLEAYVPKVDWTKPAELHSAVRRAGQALGLITTSNPETLRDWEDTGKQYQP